MMPSIQQTAADVAVASGALCPQVSEHSLYRHPLNASPGIVA